MRGCTARSPPLPCRSRTGWPTPTRTRSPHSGRSPGERQPSSSPGCRSGSPRNTGASPAFPTCGVAAATIAAAAIFPVGCTRPACCRHPGFPAIHALLLRCCSAAARRLPADEGEPGRDSEAGQSVLLVGAGDGADLFIRALPATRGALADRRLLSLGRRRPGGAFTACDLGTLDEAPAILARCAPGTDCPRRWW